MKPANLLVDAVGTVKILDFALARFDNDDEGAPAVFSSTVAYPSSLHEEPLTLAPLDDLP